MADVHVLYTNSVGFTRAVDDVLDTRITVKKDARNNSAEFFFPSRPYTLDGEVEFRAGELLQVYMSNTVVDRDNPAPGDLKGTFKILDINHIEDEKKINLVCSDFTYDLLSTIFTRDIRGKTSPEIIELVLQNGVADGTKQINLTTDLQALKSNGLPFPANDYTSLNKTAYDIISEVSQTNYTGDDRIYIFWFDPDGTFHWEYPDFTVQESFVHGQEPVLSMKTGKVESQVITFVIFDAGKDFNGAGILGSYLKPDAGSIKGMTIYEPMQDIADKFRQQAINDGLTNDQFVTFCLSVGEAEAKKKINREGEAVYEATVEVKAKHYTPGKFYSVASDMLPATKMRLNRVVNKFNREGWNVMLELEEDPSKES